MALVSIDPTFFASNHQNLTPNKGLIPFLVVVYFTVLKNRNFVKSLNFLFHGTPQTADTARNAVRSSEVREKLSDFSAARRHFRLCSNLKIRPFL